ncbi:hypothetical protein RHSIM_Rhsim11G0103900 [Rhododendron simsii]|uniref:F-box associated beta-propeller type 3 domain-containing protein n=1 Tax=Rhododendron simsii TaxID=118357 RepID=A0A834LAR2_RHOSS|nr:hypothetical protein RHSIM_Rhsim11G0103900 [Rhododendron simsii]
MMLLLASLLGISLLLSTGFFIYALSMTKKSTRRITMAYASFGSFYKGSMVLECLTWIPCLWDKLICSLNISKDGFAVQDLPREILVDILSRLPGDCVLECRRDYRLLFVHHRLLFHLMEGVPFEYFLYSLGGKFWKKLNDFPYRPNALTPPTILNGVLHWIVNPYWVYEDVIPPCSNSIMMFNMDTEEFRSMPHPGSECPIRKEHKRVCIFEMKGKLAFCHPYSSLVYVSVLEDYEKWIWVNRYSVNLYLDVERYPFVITHFSPSYRNTLITIVDIQNDELLFDWGSRGVFRYNMHQKTVKQINGVGMKKTPLLPF